jgi:hypothetical protein
MGTGKLRLWKSGDIRARESRGQATGARQLLFGGGRGQARK